MAIDKNIPDQGIDEAKLEKEVFSERGRIRGTRARRSTKRRNV